MTNKLSSAELHCLLTKLKLYIIMRYDSESSRFNVGLGKEVSKGDGRRRVKGMKGGESRGWKRLRLAHRLGCICV